MAETNDKCCPKRAKMGSAGRIETKRVTVTRFRTRSAIMVDEVVDTSDVEERELLAAEDSRYYAQAWKTNVSYILLVFLLFFVFI
jgi:chemotaxis signal transduction protein